MGLLPSVSCQRRAKDTARKKEALPPLPHRFWSNSEGVGAMGTVGSGQEDEPDAILAAAWQGAVGKGVSYAVFSKDLWLSWAHRMKPQSSLMLWGPWSGELH